MRRLCCIISAQTNLKFKPEYFTTGRAVPDHLPPKRTPSMHRAGSRLPPLLTRAVNQSRQIDLARAGDRIPKSQLARGFAEALHVAQFHLLVAADHVGQLGQLDRARV